MSKPREIRERLSSWLERARDVKDAAPWVQQALEQVEWQEATLAARPSEAGAIPEDVNQAIDLLHRQVGTFLAPLQGVDIRAVTLVNSISTSTSSVIYTSVIKVPSIDSPSVQDYIESHGAAYVQLQERQNRFAAAKDWLARLSSSLATQFERAKEAYHAARACVGERSAAALEIRTFMGMLEGELFEKARRHSKENMTWERMVDILLPRADQAATREELLRQKKTRAKLLDELSDVAKRREGVNIQDLDKIWVRTLDHVYVVAAGVLSVCNREDR